MTMHDSIDHEHQQPWGLLAQFRDVDQLLSALDRLREDGFTSLEAYTPFPVEGVDQRLKLKRSPMPWVILLGGILGGSSVYALEYWINLYAYPINVAGRPLHSWPAFLPPTFEGTVLIASIFALIGVILVCGLPRVHHPVFEVEAFKRASHDGFFVAVTSDDKKFDQSILNDRLTAAGALEVWEVPHV